MPAPQPLQTSLSREASQTGRLGWRRGRLLHSPHISNVILDRYLQHLADRALFGALYRQSVQSGELERRRV